MDFGGRVELFRALTGSHNYNLNNAQSDKDYKVFVAPTFDDLYSGKQFSTSSIGDTEDFDVHDIRKVGDLWWKSNINFLEVLFTDNLVVGNSISNTARQCTSELFAMRPAIATMNLPYLYDACMGMHHTKKHQVGKGTKGTQHLVDKYGYDTKQAMHSLRVLQFIKRFADGGFKDFKQAIWYDTDDVDRNSLVSVRSGLLTKLEYLDLADRLLDAVQPYRTVYENHASDSGTRDVVLNLVKRIVKEQLR